LLLHQQSWYLQYQKQNKMRTEAMKESLRWSWCLDRVDNDIRQKLQWPKLVGMKKSVSQQHSIEIDSSHRSSMEQRKSGMLLIAQQSLEQVVEDDERNNAKCMEIVPEIERVCRFCNDISQVQSIDNNFCKVFTGQITVGD
jgi:hypothetical protein